MYAKLQTPRRVNFTAKPAKEKMRDVVMRCFCADRWKKSWRSALSRRFRNRRQPGRCSEENDKIDRGRIWCKGKLAL